MPAARLAATIALLTEGGMMIPASSDLGARAGDTLVLRGRHLGQPDRYAEIIEVLGERGRPPCRVLLADGRIATYSPDSRSPSRVCVEHVGRATRL